MGIENRLTTAPFFFIMFCTEQFGKELFEKGERREDSL